MEELQLQDISYDCFLLDAEIYPSVGEVMHVGFVLVHDFIVWRMVIKDMEDLSSCFIRDCRQDLPVMLEYLLLELLQFPLVLGFLEIKPAVLEQKRFRLDFFFLLLESQCSSVFVWCIISSGCPWEFFDETQLAHTDLLSLCEAPHPSQRWHTPKIIVTIIIISWDIEHRC